MTNAAFELTLDADGLWQLQLNNELHHGVVVVRAFPIGAPDEAVSILSAEGHELLWLPHPLQLPQVQQQAVMKALQAREFMPEIERVDTVSSFITPSTWSVQTNRGLTQFVLRGQYILVDPARRLVMVNTAVRSDARDRGNADTFALWEGVRATLRG